MAFSAQVLEVLIASPGDTNEERTAVERALLAWNSDRAKREGLILLPRRWETDVAPRLGASSQSVINEELVDRADIVIALFDSRLGMATEAAVSGTAEEIQRSNDAGKPVHVWFSDEPISRDADLGQVTALERFKDTLRPLGLLGSYTSPDDLAFKVRQAIESDLDRLEIGPPQQVATEPSVKLRAHYESSREPRTDSHGRTTMRTTNQQLVVENLGRATATQVRVTLEAIDGIRGEPPGLYQDGDAAPTLIPASQFSWPLVIHMGTSRAARVVMRYTEDESEYVEQQDVAFGG